MITWRLSRAQSRCDRCGRRPRSSVRAGGSTTHIVVVVESVCALTGGGVATTAACDGPPVRTKWGCVYDVDVGRRRVCGHKGQVGRRARNHDGRCRTNCAGSRLVAGGAERAGYRSIGGCVWGCSVQGCLSLEWVRARCGGVCVCGEGEGRCPREGEGALLRPRLRMSVSAVRRFRGQSGAAARGAPPRGGGVCDGNLVCGCVCVCVCGCVCVCVCDGVVTRAARVALARRRRKCALTPVTRGVRTNRLVVALKKRHALVGDIPVAAGVDVATSRAGRSLTSGDGGRGRPPPPGLPPAGSAWVLPPPPS
jgi:hypothetical protein